MQRSISNQKSLAPFIYIILFIVYEGLSSIYLYLPPLLAVLAVLFFNALRDDDAMALFLVSICLVIFEAEKGYIFFSSIIFLAIVYKFIMPRLIQSFSCASCIKFLSVLIAYIGFYLFCIVLSNVFLLPAPEISYYIIYYIVIEFFIVSIL